MIDKIRLQSISYRIDPCFIPPVGAKFHDACNNEYEYKKDKFSSMN
jgi:hypothetical protein